MATMSRHASTRIELDERLRDGPLHARELVGTLQESGFVLGDHPLDTLYDVLDDHAVEVIDGRWVLPGRFSGSDAVVEPAWHAAGEVRPVRCGQLQVVQTEWTS